MTTENFNTDNPNFNKLLGNGVTYHVPRFQRDYSWTQDEWSELWLDIIETIKSDGESHYMGYLVLQSDDSKKYFVIDGQQRLTTLSIFVLAAMRNLKDISSKSSELNLSSNTNSDTSNIENAGLLLNTLRDRYISFRDLVTLQTHSKLKLNRNNNDYYQNYIVQLVDRLPQRGINSSERGLLKAFEYFYYKIKDFVKEDSEKVRAIGQLVEDMSFRLFFTVITVTNELNAYKVFETLNARGVRLSTNDLLKNYLFMVLHKAQSSERYLNEVETRWENLVNRLGSEDFPNFLRNHWNSRHKYVREKLLFEEISNKIKKTSEVFAMISDLDLDIDTYVNLRSPDSAVWTNSLKENARLLRLFGIRQPYPLLMSVERRFPEQLDFVMNLIIIISFRYNVICNLHNSDQESVYNHLAVEIFNGKYQDARQLIPGLKPIYPNDDVFRASFAEKSFSFKQNRATQITKYLLAKIEKKISGNELNYQSDELSIEHICPTNPNTGWDNFPDADIQNLANRIGNLTLLTKNQNREAANHDFDLKKSIYAKSTINLTKAIGEKYIEWTPETVASRQKELAKLATNVWRIDQLSQ
ncbi:MAG: DUF262 domain-containing HNH endonuclease family protein [Alphaproteobacteria bacterium]|nr:DUF262 domain-containing HNH endonuclease family protein [Alphaproteobacteria bacterium]